jgi:hypothetical protein
MIRADHRADMLVISPLGPPHLMRLTTPGRVAGLLLEWSGWFLNDKGGGNRDTTKRLRVSPEEIRIISSSQQIASRNFLYSEDLFHLEVLNCRHYFSYSSQG